MILEDFYPFLDDNPVNIRILRSIARSSKNTALVLSQPFASLPKELEKDTHIITLDLPQRENLEFILKQVYMSKDVEYDNFHSINERLIDSALGLTIMEARKIFHLLWCIIGISLEIAKHSLSSPKKSE